jgi:hypothetical protein
MKRPRRVPARDGLLPALTVLAAVCVAWGAARAIAFGEQQPARSMLFVGGIALAVCLVTWAERRGRS